MLSRSDIPSRIFILGAGSMGSIVAHEVSKNFQSEIEPVLLFKNSRRLNTFSAGGHELKVIRKEGSNVTSSTSRVLGSCHPLSVNGKKVPFIENLVIATKTFQTEHAIKPYIPLLNAKSNIIFLQNGMGMRDALMERFWASEKQSPNIFQAISTHGAYKTSPNVIQHVARGKLSLAHIPKSSETWMAESELPFAINALLRTDVLNPAYIAFPQFLLLQIEKLIVNACINPLTAIFNCLNGELLYGRKTSKMMQRIIREAIQAIFSEHQILNDIPTARAYLDEDRLLNSVIDICKLTEYNSSSMREDVLSLEKTEINWINGYISQLGQKNRVPTPVNNMLVAMIHNIIDINKALEENSFKRSMDI